MTHFHHYILFSAFFLLNSCTGNERTPSAIQALQSRREMTDYSQVPQQFRSYLDSLEGGKFLIANPDETWAAGCDRINGEPDKQFISANISADTFKIHYWQGGIAMMKRHIVLLSKNGEIQVLD
jgi:hypothetical protein